MMRIYDDFDRRLFRFRRHALLWLARVGAVFCAAVGIAGAVGGDWAALPICVGAGLFLWGTVGAWARFDAWICERS